MLKQIINDDFDAYKETLAKLIEIPSYIQNDHDTPFGKDIDHVLKSMLAIAHDAGFSTYRDPDGYYGYAEIGEGAALFGVLCHLDVVAAGDIAAWTHDPFTLVERDGYLYGRGTSDDKGPTLSAFFGLLAALKMGYRLTQRVRFIFGVDEESLWRCMKAYVAKEALPDFGIAPDSIFPLTYAEKGLIEFKLKTTSAADFKVDGAFALNAVPSRVSVNHDDNLVKALQALQYEYEEGLETVAVIGKAMHAKDADLGINALVRLSEALSKAGKNLPILNFVNEKLAQPNGIQIYGDVRDDISGKMKLNVGSLIVEDGFQEVGIDIRFPVTYPVELVREMLQSACDGAGILLEEYDYLPSIYIEKNSAFIQTLMHAYQDVSGDVVSQPISSGGATYARAMPNVVAFGGLMRDDDSCAHQADEHISIASTKTAIEIYATMFMKLCMTKESQ